MNENRLQIERSAMMTPRRIFVTETDLNRLEAIVEMSRSPNLELLKEELALATIVKSEEVPPDVVTMNSRVRFLDLDSGEESEATLVYPGDADVAARKISIVAPVGAAIFGLSVGDEIEWPVPSGKKRRFKILSVVYQPEAAGRYDL